MTREDILSRFKEKLSAGPALLGMQHNSGSAVIIEVIAYAGFDFVIIDAEHSSYSPSEIEGLIRACEAVGIVSLVRVMKNDQHMIMQALDAGASGVMIPHVLDPADCQRALDARRFKPEGIRGKSASSRAARWTLGDWDEYAQWSERETLVIPILEDREAIECVEDIVALPGLELVAVGPGDLSQSYGRPSAGLRAEEVMSALERTIDACEPSGIGVMTIPMPDMTPEFVFDLERKGVRAIWYGGDVAHAGQYFRSLVQALVDGRAEARA